MKALNSPLKKEIEFEPHQRSSFTKTMTDNWCINDSLKEVVDKNLQTLKPTDRLVDEETGPIKERVTRMEDKTKDLTKEKNSIENDRLKEMVEKQNNKEVSSSIQIIYKKLDIERQKSLIETSKKESLHEKLIDNNNKTNRKGKVKEMLERIESQQTNSKDGTLRKGLDIGKDIVKQKNMIKKDDSPRNYDDSLKELHERQKSLIETSKEDNGEKLCGKIETKEKVGKVKDMLKPKDNSTFKESLCRKLEEEEEIGKDELKKEK